jgi:hypothetical protein
MQTRKVLQTKENLWTVSDSAGLFLVTEFAFELGVSMSRMAIMEVFEK